MCVLSERQFIVGANASGKSNLLDIFRFLRDIVKSRGRRLFRKPSKTEGVSLKSVVWQRGRDPEVTIEIHLADESDSPTIWKYGLGFRQETRGYRRTYLTHERVWKNGKQLLNRPNAEDEADQDRLTQTFLEQINVNADFREIARFLQTITYIHLVPQLLRFADSIQGRIVEDDPFGQGLLERVAGVTERTRRFRLKRIEQALKIAVPQLEDLEFIRGRKPPVAPIYRYVVPTGVRVQAGKREDQFSDGTLRLLGLLWALLESESVLLLEEPELSLHTGIVSQLAASYF